MPRVAKRKAPAALKPAAKNKKHGYVKPEAIPLGTILTDLKRQQWKIGEAIGSGGFGDIYSACKSGSPQKKLSDYDYVVKVEPQGNGPLFVEMHFYIRNAKLEDIKEYCKKKGLKTLGMPHLVGHGSQDLNGEKHRFVVMPRYGKDIWSYFLQNKKCLPQHTVYRLAIQMLDVYEYIHSCTYVHADLKGANILLGLGKSGASQAYLVDFGLASHYTTKEFKPDPKKMHNGTIEYTSRDAHNGVPTLRGDLEILAYNLIHWSGATLPWEEKKLLGAPAKVQAAKEEFMKDVNGSLDKVFNKNPPSPIKQFTQYVQSLDYDQTPDYNKCCKIFQGGLKALNKTNSGELEMLLGKSPTKRRAVVESEDDSDFESNATPVRGRGRPPTVSPRPPTTAKVSPNKRPKITEKISPGRKGIQNSPQIKATMSPVVSINRLSSNAGSHRKPGKTIINDNLTPNPGSSKTYEFNFELDVSMDANVVVNVKRKKKAATSKEKNGVQSELENEIPGSNEGSPMPKVRIRKLYSTRTKTSPASASRRAK